MKLTTLTISSLCALATTLVVHAGPTDSKDMKQASQTNLAASDAGFYVAAYGGANFSTDYGDRHSSLGGSGSTPDNVHSDVGAVGGIKGGYNFASFPVCNGLRLQPAVEVEGLYIGMGSKYTSPSPGYNDSTSWNNAAGFVNGILRFKLTDEGFFSKLTPYVGVGVGAEYLTAHTDLNIAGGGHPGDVGDEDVAFAVQGLVGLDYAICNHISLFTEYKFIDAIGSSFTSDTSAGQYRFAPNQIQQNLATVGVKYSF
jgi:opacity protein-like surface antigen